MRGGERRSGAAKIALGGALVAGLALAWSAYRWMAVERSYAGSVIAYVRASRSDESSVGSGGARRTCYRTQLSYRVGETVYDWRVPGCGGLGNGVTDDGGVPLRYDPEHPGRARLAGSTAMHTPEMAGFGLGLLMLLGSCAPLVMGRTSRRAGRPSRG